MPTLQLELNLWQQLAEAQQSPQAVDWQQLCLAFDQAINQAPVEQRLETALDSFIEMAALWASRYSAFADDWFRRSEDGPIIDNSFCAQFVRQSFHLDLDGLIAEPELYVRSPSEETHEDTESLVEEVSKETALLLAGAELEPEDLMEGLEYDEDVTAWAKAIAQWMQARGGDAVGFVELLDGVGYSVVKGWLAVLLGEGFEMNRLEDSEFYRSAGILVELKREEIAIAC